MSVLQEVSIPDIGNYANVPIIEINVKPGQSVEKEEVLFTLESDKAAMEIPSPYTGVIKEVKVKVGDKVSKGTLAFIMEIEEGGASPTPEAEKEPARPETTPEADKNPPASETKREAHIEPRRSDADAFLYASPIVRRRAREMGIELSQVRGTGQKGRILEEDLQNFVKQNMEGRATGGSGLPTMPEIDFSQFGEVTVQPMSRIKKLSAVNLHRNWVVIPHVTQFDEVDITELEEFRQAHKNEFEKEGLKLTFLIFLMKAVVKALQAFPSFNASISPDGENLILKKYFNIGVAVDTPNGLVVPVVRNVENKELLELAKDLAECSEKARKGKLTAAEMQGSCFSISSLGGIGGTAFTPIINAPDVAILGVSKSQYKPIYIDGQFVPRLMLPLSLSYDHRVIDGAEAARFITQLGKLLQDIRLILL